MQLKSNRTPALAALVALLITLLMVSVAAAAPAGPERSVHIVGPVQDRPIPPAVLGEWQIAGRVVLVNEQTRFQPGVAAIAAGDMVVVEARLRDNVLVAQIIIKMPPPVNRVIAGKIESIAPAKWQIGSQEVLVDGETRIEGDQADLGDWAMAWVERTAAGLLAKRIQVKDPAPPPPSPGPRLVVFQGVVKSIDDAGVYVVTAGDGDRTVRTDEQTRIVGSPVEGDRVLVNGRLMDDGSIQALLIAKIEGQPDDQQPFAGFVTEVVSSTVPTASAAEAMQWQWKVEQPAHDDKEAQAWAVVVDAGTNIDVDPNTVEVGAFVKGAGAVQPDGSILARVVRVVRPPQVRFAGEITGPENCASFPWCDFQVGGKTVHVTADTRLVGDPPAAGRQAAGHGFLRFDGSIDARLFMVR